MSNDWTLAESETVEGLTVEVRVSEHVDENDSPRDWSQIGRMVCWHPDYYLGDAQVTDGDGRGAVRTPFERNDFKSMRALARYITLVLGGRCVMPLYLYDHSGISISVGEPNPFDNPRVRSDEFGRGLGWDTSMVGFIYASEEGITECCGEGAEYRTEEFLSKALRGEIREYDDYLTGQVYYWRVLDAEGEQVEDGGPCGGYLGDDGRKAALADGREFAEVEARERKERAAAEEVERERAASQDIATVSA